MSSQEQEHQIQVLKQELGVHGFETGYPVDLGSCSWTTPKLWPQNKRTKCELVFGQSLSRLRRELGPEVTIHGGPSAIFLKQAAPDEVRSETGRILNAGICDGGRFVLRQGNNLAPGTPLANLQAMYETARAWSP